MIVLVVIIDAHPCEKVEAKVIELLHDVDTDWQPLKAASLDSTNRAHRASGIALVEHLGLVELPSTSRASRAHVIT